MSETSEYYGYEEDYPSWHRKIVSNPLTAAEWARWFQDVHGPCDMNGLESTLVAYARQQVEAFRERAARLAEICHGAGAHTPPQGVIAAAIRALP